MSIRVSSWIRNVWEYARDVRGIAIKATLYSMINIFFDITPEIMIGIVVDTVVNQQTSWLALLIGIYNPYHQLTLLIVLTIVFYVLESLFEYLHGYWWRMFGQHLQHTMRCAAYDHIQHAPLSIIEQKRVGELISIVNDDVNQIERFFEQDMHMIIYIITSLIMIGGVFCVLSPLIFICAITPLPLIIYGSIYFQRKLEHLFGSVRVQAARISSQLINNVYGLATIKSFVREAFERREVERMSEAYLHSNERAIHVAALTTPIIRFSVLLGYLSPLIIGGVMAIGGSFRIGAFSMMVFMAQRLLWPFAFLGNVVQNVERMGVSVRRVMNIMQLPQEINSGEAPFVAGDIMFKHVSFAYDRAPILDNFSLEVPFGHTIGFVGETGSGKTTLIKLLLRFYHPSAGDIIIGNTPLHRIELKELRRHIGYVSQDTFLFPGTVHDNIAFGRSDLSRDEVYHAAHLARVHDFIEKLDQGYDTVIGEGGVSLSGGQRQRISLARAIAKDPPILILDEATSAVDNETEKEIQRSLRTITQNRITLIIAHRLSTITHAHAIYVLKQGAIIECGTHDELVARDGAYATLWKIQTGQI